MTNIYLEKVSSLAIKNKSKSTPGSAAAITGAVGLLASGAHSDFKSLSIERRRAKFLSSAYPKVQSVRKKAYADTTNVKADRLRQSVSDKYYKVKHGLANKADKLAGKAHRRYVASTALAGLSLYLYRKNNPGHNDK